MKGEMENKYFSLSTVESNRVVRIIQVIFGIVCLIVSVYWLIFNARSLKVNNTLWVTIAFLAGFGFYQIWAGLGQATKFIEISSSRIRLKRFVLLPAVEIQATELQKIELFPLNLIFFLKPKKRILLRFGTTYYETNEKIKDEILNFAENNTIQLEIIEEKL